MKMKIEVPPNAPYAPARLWSDIVYAVKALGAGEATKEQQGLLLQWVIIDVCKKDDMSYRPGGLEGDRDSAMAEGKRYVALQFLRALNMPLDKVAEMRAAENPDIRSITEGEQGG